MWRGLDQGRERIRKAVPWGSFITTTTRRWSNVDQVKEGEISKVAKQVSKKLIAAVPIYRDLETRKKAIAEAVATNSAVEMIIIAPESLINSNITQETQERRPPSV